MPPLARPAAAKRWHRCWPCRRAPGIWLFRLRCWNEFPAEEELARYGRSRAVQGISTGDAHEFLCQLQADEAFSPVRTAAARAAVWDAFFRQDLDLLPTTLPDALRASSSALLTDLTALDYDALERTLEFLANNSAAVAAQALPGQWDAASGTYTVTDASRAAMQTFFNVSPTEAQASSFSEP